MINKSYQKILINQEKLTKFNPIVQEFLDNPQKFISKLRKNRIRLLNHFIALHRKYEKIYVAQGKTAAIVKCSRQHVNYGIKDLVAWGFLTKRQRYNTSCVYELSSIFDLPDIKQKLRKLLPSLWALPLALLVSFSPKVTLPNIKILGKEYYISTAQKRKLMDNQAVIRADIERIKFKSIQLTLMGKIKLMAFPPEIIIEALEKLKNATDVRNPYNYLYKLCLDQAQIENIEPDFGYISGLIHNLGLSKDDPDFSIKGKDESPPSGFSHMQSRYKTRESVRLKQTSPYVPWKGFPERDKKFPKRSLNEAALQFLKGLGDQASAKIRSFMNIEKEESSNESEICNTGRAIFSDQTPSTSTENMGSSRTSSFCSSTTAVKSTWR